MRCQYCQRPAGLFRRICGPCGRVVEIIHRFGAELGLIGLVDRFAAEGFSRPEVDRVLDAPLGDRPTLRDELTSQLTNVLMRGLGMPGRQSPEDVRRVRLGLAAAEPERTNLAAGGPAKITGIEPANADGPTPQVEGADER